MLSIVSSKGWPLIKGSLVGVASFTALGTVAGLWSNPFFTRMTPAGGWEIALLAVLSLLLGVYIAIRRPRCSARSASLGGIAGFLGIACPTCNKVLMLLFGGDLLLAYFEPIRLYVAAAGVLIMSLVTWREWTRSQRRLDGKPPRAAGSLPLQPPGDSLQAIETARTRPPR